MSRCAGTASQRKSSEEGSLPVFFPEPHLPESVRFHGEPRVIAFPLELLSLLQWGNFREPLLVPAGESRDVRSKVAPVAALIHGAQPIKTLYFGDCVLQTEDIHQITSKSSANQTLLTCPVFGY